MILHNIPESNSADVDERKAYDTEQVQEILSYLEVENSEVKQPVRLGKKGSESESRKPRLLKVTLGDVSTKKETLSKAKKLRSSPSKKHKKVYITQDLTFKETGESRKLREKLAERRRNGESDLVIKNGRINKGSRPFRGKSEEFPDGGGFQEW